MRAYNGWSSCELWLSSLDQIVREINVMWIDFVFFFFKFVFFSNFQSFSLDVFVKISISHCQTSVLLSFMNDFEMSKTVIDNTNSVYRFAIDSFFHMCIRLRVQCTLCTMRHALYQIFQWFFFPQIIHSNLTNLVNACTGQYDKYMLTIFHLFSIWHVQIFIFIFSFFFNFTGI